MSFEEKNAWIMAVVSAVAYAVYVALILGRAEGGPLTEVAYASTLLWSIGASVAASVVGTIVVVLAAPKEADQKDIRDRQIHRRGEYLGHGFVIAGGVAALVLALAEHDHFWIANVLYLGFVLSAVVGSTAKVLAYRRGFEPW